MSYDGTLIIIINNIIILDNYNIIILDNLIMDGI